ncbi:Transcriptional regulator WhiD [Actinomyces naeslundii]|uniref:WhiB family transcriptional regulator n=1 Tax=Actinomyces TaxID=1654 RepID=UPI00094CA8E2|nr:MULTISPECIES: WhiB family transcriptional regulator [Actinomyces]MDO4654775.1 WhiB family transcriptional regulator [Actinomyces sp.]OLO77028.1 transcription factor WhiB [Actinomyces oris]VTX92011.1 Transcriptional regulator WhiD [Actinomyces naeslundii]
MHDSSRLPGPISTLWEWQYRGACLGMDSSVFFHPEGERGGSRRRRDERAKAICQDCPVLDECRDHALSTREPYGVWGGMSEEERRAYYERQARRFTDEPA